MWWFRAPGAAGVWCHETRKCHWLLTLCQIGWGSRAALFYSSCSETEGKPSGSHMAEQVTVRVANVPLSGKHNLYIKGNVWVSFDKNWPEPSLGDQSYSQGLAGSVRALYCIHTVGLLTVPSSCRFKDYIWFGFLFSFSFSVCTLPPAKEEWGRVCSSTCVAKDVTARKPGVNSSTVSILKNDALLHSQI